MEYEVQTVIGPRTASVKKADALEALLDHPDKPEGALLEKLEERNGQWVAHLRVPKQAAPFPPGAGEDDAPTPPGPEDAGPPKDKGIPGDEDSSLPDDESDEGSSKSDEPKKPSAEEAIAHLTDVVQQIADALGIGPGGPPGHPGAGPEADAGLTPPPPPGGPGHAGPGKGPGAMQRSRPLKPGDAPNAPGVTPVGAPAFASVREDHPWKRIASEVQSFTVSQAYDPEQDDDGKLISRASTELQDLAGELGLHARQIRRGKDDDGTPVIKALITAR